MKKTFEPQVIHDQLQETNKMKHWLSDLPGGNESINE